MQKLKTSFQKIKRKINKNNKVVSVLCIVIGILYFFYILTLNSKMLFSKYDPIQAEIKYSQSQWQQSQNVAVDKILDEWAIKNNYTGWSNYEDETANKLKAQSNKQKIIKASQDKGVSDSFLYSYVGYKYINGINPSLLNPEHPPLAKYLIGLSIIIFSNEHIVGIGIAFIVLLLVAIISYQIYNSIFLASIMFLITALFPLFTDQIVNGPQLELYQLFFFLLVVHLLLMWTKKKKIIYVLFAGVFFGLLLSTKTLLPFFLLFGTWLIIGLWKQWKVLLIIFFVGALTFCMTYFSFFAQGGTLRTFLGLQKYIVTFYGHSNIPLFEFVGNYLRLIFTGSWKFWDTARSVTAYSEWNILWPIIFLIGMYKLKIQWSKYKYSHLLIWFIILYNLFVFIVPVFPRYLLLLFTPLIILI